MREPADVPSHAAGAPLGASQPTAVAAASAPLPPPPAGTAPSGQQSELAPIRIAAEPKPRPYPLRDSELVLPSGLVIHRVPKGTTVQSAREQQTGDMVWEIADARGRRVALLKERSFRAASAATAPVLDATTTLRLEARRSDWGPAPVRVIVDRFRGEHYIYTLERRESGAEWIWSNLELTNRPASEPRGE
jgi:hypothetical protein